MGFNAIGHSARIAILERVIEERSRNGVPNSGYEENVAKLLDTLRMLRLQLTEGTAGNILSLCEKPI